VDEAPRKSSPAVETDTPDQQRSPEEIRADIEHTREQLGDTAAGVAQKADVKAQAKAKIDETKQRVADKKDEVVGKAKQTSPDSASQVAGQALDRAKENPLPVAAGGAFVVGFLLGRLFGRHS
jgi:ElaB/YqjD/DUF883 family membrane-anchored ribosome-binding protein